MKGERRLKVLEFIEDSIQLADDIFFIFTLPFGTSFSRMDYLLEKKHEQIDRDQINRNIERKRERRRFDDFLYRLRKDGLVSEVNKKGKYFLKLTTKGRSILEKLKINYLPAVKYENTKDETLKIIIFDIPEEERRKRAWLRSALKNLNFKMIQKSVWLGKVKLPREFIDDLERINILSYIEIFAITKTGSLRQLKNN